MSNSAERRGAHGAVRKSAVSVLLVDDDPHCRAALERGLASRGYRIATAESAEQALEVLGGSPVNVVVTDLRMPGQDGLELIRTVCSRYPETRSILISGNIQPSERTRAFALGASDVLDKPFTPLELAKAVDAAVRDSS